MASQGTPGGARRSARIGSAAPGPRSVTSQSAVSVIIAQETTKSTPGRPKALPKVKTRQSNAYGASGRLGTAQELAIPQTGFAEAFQAQRGAAIARNSPAGHSSARGGSARQTASRSRERDTPSQSEYESEDPLSEEEQSEDEEDISAETSKSFGIEAGMLRQPTPLKQTPAPRRNVAFGAVASGPTRPLDSPVGTQPESGRRVPSTQPLNTPLAEQPPRVPVRDAVTSASTPRIPIVRPAQEATASGFTPRAPAAQPVQEPSTGPRASFVRPAPPIRVGGYTPRIPTDRPTQLGVESTLRTPLLRPTQTPTGASTTSRPLPARVVPQAQVEPEVEPGVSLVDKIKALPWLHYGRGALAALAALAAIAIAVLFANSSAPSAISAHVADGWRGFTSRLTPGRSSSHVVNGNLKARVDNVELTLKDIQDYIHSLGKDVPDYVVVSRSPSGTMNVPKQFWDAIISRIRKEGPSIEWDTFVQGNRDKLQTALGTEAAVIRQDLFKAIDSSFNEIATDFNKKLEAHTRILTKDVEKVATKEAKKVAVEHARLRSMALSNLIANIELQHSKPNYFSTGLGASIITGITSPTFARNTVSAPALRVLKRFVAASDNPPVTALQSWEEPGDCWCAAPNEASNGKAQLGIQLGEPMLPTQLTIEHLPRFSAPADDIRSAPQNVEIWVESEAPALMRFAFDGERCDDGPEGWQCLGKVRYDRNGANHVQTFLLDGEAQTPVNKVLLRVTSNWGSDHTCLYRVRLHGKGLRPVPEEEATP